VFDRFYRAPNQEKSGAGLGLAIVREIVVAHGGRIACTRPAGKGAEVFFAAKTGGVRPLLSAALSFLGDDAWGGFHLSPGYAELIQEF